MPNLYTISLVNQESSEKLSQEDKLSIAYHNIFDFPLSFADLNKWTPLRQGFEGQKVSIMCKNGYYFVEGKEASIYKRALHKRISARKFEIAKKVANILSFIPTVKMVAVTGSLAMENSNEGSDIDLMIVTKDGSLWTTRAFAYLLICLFGIKKRSPLDKVQKDKLCLNIWLDESDLVWRERNLYTAHEIAQIVPLINKDKIYEKFLFKNRWIKSFWPNSVKIGNWKFSENWKLKTGKFNLLEKAFYSIQYNYMKSKITRETITKTRALFHPQDWGKVVLTRLAS